MTRLVWGTPGARIFETGIDQATLYPMLGDGVPWIGVTSVKESPSGGDVEAFYVDGVKYLNQVEGQEYTSTLEAYTYPDEFAECDGTVWEEGLGYDEQPRKPFNLSYRTTIGDDLQGIDRGYRLHLIFNAIATPSDRDYKTLGASIETVDFSWSLSTTPVRIPGKKATSHLILDSRTTNEVLLETLEDILYGTETTAARFPTADEIIELYNREWPRHDGLLVIDNKDGTYSISGPDEVVSFLGDFKYQISSEGVVPAGPDTYTITS